MLQVIFTNNNLQQQITFLTLVHSVWSDPAFKQGRVEVLTALSQDQPGSAVAAGASRRNLPP